MNKWLYGSLALVATHFTSGAIVVSGAPGGPLSISIDAPIVLNSTSSTATGDMVLVFANAYSSDQSSGNFAFSSATFILSATSITSGGNATVAQVPPGSGSDYGLDDFGIVFLTNTAPRSPAEAFTVSIGAASTAAAMPLPTNSGSYDLYLVDESGTRFTDFATTNVSFTVIPEPGAFGTIAGVLGLLVLVRRRRS